MSTHYSIDKGNTLNSPEGLTPQENFTLTPEAEFSLLEGIIKFTGAVTFSAYTRDLNSPKVPTGELGVPAFFTNIMQAHSSSRINYAGNASANLDLNQFGLQLGYERVQPGFMSLGVGRVRDDHQNIQISPSIQLLNNRLSLQGSLTLGRDNLLGNRIQTRRNTGVGTNAQFQLSDLISVNGNYNLLVNDVSSNIGADTLQQGALGQLQVSHTFMLQPNLTFQSDQYTHNVSLSGSYFKMGSEFKGATASSPNNFESDTYSTSVNYSLSFPSGFSVNTMGNFLVYNSRNTENRSLGANVGGSHRLFDDKMTLSLNVGMNQNRNEVDRSAQNQNNIIFKGRQLMLNLTTNYRLSENGTFSLSVRNRTNNVVEGAGTKYSELEGSVSYRHRF
ncbi:MAG: hypothetical protein U5K71_09020 [Gracilimonas sp.]|nr:hypothetical protein [Gracilimonas sp.]